MVSVYCIDGLHQWGTCLRLSISAVCLQTQGLFTNNSCYCVRMKCISYFPLSSSLPVFLLRAADSAPPTSSGSSQLWPLLGTLLGSYLIGPRPQDGSHAHHTPCMRDKATQVSVCVCFCLYSCISPVSLCGVRPPVCVFVFMHLTSLCGVRPPGPGRMRGGGGATRDRPPAGAPTSSKRLVTLFSLCL